MVILEGTKVEEWSCSYCNRSSESYRWKLKVHDIDDVKFEREDGTNEDDYIALQCPDCRHHEIYKFLMAG